MAMGFPVMPIHLILDLDSLCIFGSCTCLFVALSILFVIFVCNYEYKANLMFLREKKKKIFFTGVYMCCLPRAFQLSSLTYYTYRCSAFAFLCEISLTNNKVVMIMFSKSSFIGLTKYFMIEFLGHGLYSRDRSTITRYYDTMNLSITGISLVI